MGNLILSIRATVPIICDGPLLPEMNLVPETGAQALIGKYNVRPLTEASDASPPPRQGADNVENENIVPSTECSAAFLLISDPSDSNKIRLDSSRH